MTLDTSAVMAILEHEPEADWCPHTASRSRRSMSAAAWVETGIVADQRRSTHGERLDELLAALEVTLQPVTERQATVARTAYRRFGRGTGSPARLDLGDCFSYALSVTTGEPRH